MTRQDFLYQLAEELMSLPPEERISALKYYEEYFEDAGPDQEQEVLRELGSPQAVARTILADYAQREPGSNSYYSQREPGSGSYYAGGPNPPRPPVYTPAAPRNGRSPGTTVLLIVLAVIFGWPLLIAAFGLFMGLLGSIIALVVALVTGFVGLLVGGVFAVARGIIGIAVSPATGLLQLAGGLASTGMGLALMLGGLWLVAKVLPRFLRWVVSVIRRLFRIDN